MNPDVENDSWYTSVLLDPEQSNCVFCSEDACAGTSFCKALFVTTGEYLECGGGLLGEFPDKCLWRGNKAVTVEFKGEVPGPGKSQTNPTLYIHSSGDPA